MLATTVASAQPETPLLEEAEEAPVDDGDATSEAAPQAPEPKEAEPEAAIDTGLQGRVVDRTTKQGLPGAVVLVQVGEESLVAVTDDEGVYRLAIPPGRYSVLAYVDLYRAARFDSIVVRSGRFTNVTFVLRPLAEEDAAQEVIEIAYEADTSGEEARLNLRRAQTNVEDSVSAEEISRSGDGDAGAAARRVVGVSVEDSRLVVRGLGNRYSRVLLNDVVIPSIDPDSPGVELDIFPTSVVSGFAVVKTARPDLPSDFAGGLLLIDSTSFPTELTLEGGVSLGYSSEATLRQIVDYDGGNYDWLTVNSRIRQLPSSVPGGEILDISRDGSFRDYASIEAVAEDFANRWQYHRRRAWPGLGVGLTVGDTLELGGGVKLGFLATAGYDHDDARERGSSRPRPSVTAQDDGTLLFQPRSDYQYERGTEEAAIHGLLSAGLHIGKNHDLTALSLLSRTMQDETSLREGYAADYGGTARSWQLRFIERQLLFNQILGDHRDLGGKQMRLRWNVFLATGERMEPDARTILYGPNGGLYRWLEKSNSGERFYGALTQLSTGAQTSFRFPLWVEGWGTVGGVVQGEVRDFSIRRFRMLQQPGVTDQTVYTQDAETLFSAEGIGQWTRMKEVTSPADSYHSEQKLYVGFALLETKLVGALRAAGGVRLEVFDQLVRAINPFDANNPIVNETRRTDIDVLPSATLVLPFAEKMVVRAAYGLTTSRPLVRELAPYRYYDFIRERNVSGNPELERTLIHNADLRWEYYLGGTDLLAATGFFKGFINPIELVIANPENYDASYKNAAGALAYGVELEARLGLERLIKALRWFSLGGNLSLIHSEVQLRPEDAGAVQGERPMFGQSPYVANLSLRFEHPDLGFRTTLSYNVFGPRITEVGVRASAQVLLPNIIEEPFHSLDLTGSWQIGRHFSMKLKLKNLLFQTRRFTQGGFELESKQVGLSGSLSATWSY